MRMNYRFHTLKKQVFIVIAIIGMLFGFANTSKAQCGLAETHSLGPSFTSKQLLACADVPADANNSDAFALDPVPSKLTGGELLLADRSLYITYGGILSCNPPQTSFQPQLEIFIYRPVVEVSFVLRNQLATTVAYQVSPDVGSAQTVSLAGGEESIITLTGSVSHVSITTSNTSTWKFSIYALEARAVNRCNTVSSCGSITSVTLSKLDSTPLEDNPTAMGGGKMIFPDADTPTGSLNREILVTIQSTKINSQIYVASFDMDDAGGIFSTPDHTGFDNQGPTVRPEPNILEPGAFRLSNGSLVSNQVVTLQTDAQGMATVRFLVTMQPGDNFRIVASVNSALLLGFYSVQGLNVIDGITGNNLDETGNATSGCSITSPLLTVWRRLHVEVDSMAAPPDSTDPLAFTDPERNFIKGNIIGIQQAVINGNTVVTILNLELLTTDVLLRDRSRDLSSRFRGPGRFENGTIVICPTIADCTGGLAFGPLFGNGYDYVRKDTGFTIPFNIVNSSGNNPIVGNVIGIDTNTNAFIIDGNVVAGDTYSGGTLVVAGVTFSVSSAAGPNINVNGIPRLPFTLTDDDQEMAPFISNLANPAAGVEFELMQPFLTTNNNIYAAAYIKPVYDFVNQTSPPFKRNIRADQANDDDAKAQLTAGRDSVSTDDYWTCYVQGAFQEDTLRDQDPNGEGPVIFGWTPDLDYRGSFIFFEAGMRDFPASGLVGGGTPPLDRHNLIRVTVAHEVGHQFGLMDSSQPGGNPGGIMDQGLPGFTQLFFSNGDLRLLRLRIKP